jgi:hypothetical protein
MRGGQITATAKTEADPYGMTNKKGNGKDNDDDNDNRRSFDCVTRKARVTSLRMTLFEGLEKKKQRQRQKQIPFGDDKQKDTGNGNSNRRSFDCVTHKVRE